MSFDGAKVRRFLVSCKHFWQLCAKTARFLTQIKDISDFIHFFASTHIIIYNGCIFATTGEACPSKNFILKQPNTIHNF